jgi:hypothetical protein
MDLTFRIENLSYWQYTAPDGVSEEVAVSVDKKGWPKLPHIPPMQRRRLTPFMKMALHCAYQVCENQPQALPTVFSSRHGDLTQTSALLVDLANQEDLSPTAFSLSVHNAVAGLYSILSQNKQASTTISAGINTFAMGLLEAIVRAKTLNTSVLFVHTDRVMPDIYSAFHNNEEPSHSLAMVISSQNHGVANNAALRTSTQAPSLCLNKGAVGFEQWWLSTSTKANIGESPTTLMVEKLPC